MLSAAKFALGGAGFRQPLVLAMLLVMAPAAGFAQSVWDGNATNTTWYTDSTSVTYYTITTAEQLAGLAVLVNGNPSVSFEGKTIRLESNINLNKKEWTSIGSESTPFKGSFNGNGKVIKNLSINKPAADNLGLFGYASGAKISNLGLDSVDVKGRNSVGSISGNGGKIANSYVRGNIEGNGNLGGIMGYGPKVWADSANVVANSYFVGKITKNTNQGSSGGIIGNYTGSSDIRLVRNSYYNSDSVNSSADPAKSLTNPYSGYGISTDDMKSEDFRKRLQTNVQMYNEISNNYIGWVYNAKDYPTFGTPEGSINIKDYFASGNGTAEEPFIVTTRDHLENLAFLVNSGESFRNKYIKLDSDIDLSGKEWVPIGMPFYAQWGSPDGAFRGNFDGNGKVISGLYTAAELDYQGLFCYAYEANISNLGLTKLNVKGTGIVNGGIIGLGGSNVITNSYVIGNVAGNYNGITGNDSPKGNIKNTLTNVYFVGKLNGEPLNHINTEKRDSAEMKDSVLYILNGFEFGYLWTIDTTNNGYPVHIIPKKTKIKIVNPKVYLKNSIRVELYNGGNVIEPVVDSVYFGDTLLSAEDDYNVLYYNNKEVSDSAKIIILGKGNYYGATVLDFYITERRNISTTTITGLSTQTATGDSLKPKPVVKDFNGAVTLREGIDYTLEYSNNVFKGQAKVTIKGKGEIYGETSVDKNFNITGQVYVYVNWNTSCDTTFLYNGNFQHPKIDTTTKYKEYLSSIKGIQKDAGLSYEVSVESTNNGISLQNNSCSYSINPIELKIDWSEQREFVYNKMKQSPIPSFDSTLIAATDTLDFILLASSVAGVYKDSTAAIFDINSQDPKAKNYKLLTNRAEYTILKKDLNPYFAAALPDFETNKSDTLLVPYAVFNDSTVLRIILDSLLAYDGFATDTIQNTNDDKSVLSENPKITLQYENLLATSHSPLAKRVETTQKATATIITDNVSADNYALSRPVITIMAIVEEDEEAEKIFCRREYNCANFSEAVCNTIGGEKIQSCNFKVACIINNVCAENISITDCRLVGTPTPTCNATPMLPTIHLPLATSQIPKYYSLKGTPIGTVKPTTPGIYIEVRDKTRKVIVK
ncbi:MAG: hypothetical protein FWC26_12280 [Fibromonadales bacterium]|nr:hypothetical protein [Fibromonadales bacterium]